MDMISVFPDGGLLTCYGIYAIFNTVNGKIYIGQTAKTFRQRLRQHRTMLIRGLHDNKELQFDWLNYGERAFEIRILEAFKEYTLIRYNLNPVEYKYITLYRDTAYNVY